MVHGDDKGLVLPPRVAPVQVVICPITIKNQDATELDNFVQNIASELKSAGVRVEVDNRLVCCNI